MDSDDDDDGREEASIHNLTMAPERRRRCRSMSEGSVRSEEGTGRARVWSSGSGFATNSPVSEPRKRSILRHSFSTRRYSGDRRKQRQSLMSSSDEEDDDGTDSVASPVANSLPADMPMFRRGSGASRTSFSGMNYAMSGSSSRQFQPPSRSLSWRDEEQEITSISQRPSVSRRRSSTSSRGSYLGGGGVASYSPSEASYDDEEDTYDTQRHYKPSHPNDRDESTLSSRPVFLCGIQLPRLGCFKSRPSWNRIAAFVVTNAPCFWCFRLGQKTDRAILQRLNILCAFVAFGQFGSMLWLLIMLALDPRDVFDGESYTVPNSEHSMRERILVNLWNINGSIFVLGVISLVVFVTTLLTVPVIRSVNLLGAIRYMWVLLWIIPFQLFFVIGLFDYFQVTAVWIRHWWTDRSMSAFRRQFCEPADSFRTLCAAPIVEDIDSWCMIYFNSTECGEIRATAQENMNRFLTTYYYFNAAWAMLMILLLLLVVNTLESIISRPLVQKSRESNVPIWFSMPIVGSFLGGALFSLSSTSILSRHNESLAAEYVGPMYMCTGAFFFLSAILGWFLSFYSILNTRDKRYKLVAITLFILSVGIIFVLLVSIFAGSISFSLSLAELAPEVRGDMACFLDQARTCTGCNNPGILHEEQCPEWSNIDVTRVLQGQAKSSAALAAIFLLYALSALRFGFGMRRYILLYQIDFV